MRVFLSDSAEDTEREIGSEARFSLRRTWIAGTLRIREEARLKRGTIEAGDGGHVGDGIVIG